MHLGDAKSNTKGNYEIGAAPISKFQSNYGRWKIDETHIRVLSTHLKIKKQPPVGWM
jgi:hypothetical protein